MSLHNNSAGGTPQQSPTKDNKKSSQSSPQSNSAQSSSPTSTSRPPSPPNPFPKSILSTANRNEESNTATSAPAHNLEPPSTLNDKPSSITGVPRDQQLFAEPPPKPRSRTPTFPTLTPLTTTNATSAHPVIANPSPTVVHTTPVEKWTQCKVTRECVESSERFKHLTGCDSITNTPTRRHTTGSQNVATSPYKVEDKKLMISRPTSPQNKPPSPVHEHKEVNKEVKPTKSFNYQKITASSSKKKVTPQPRKSSMEKKKKPAKSKKPKGKSDKPKKGKGKSKKPAKSEKAPKKKPASKKPTDCDKKKEKKNKKKKPVSKSQKAKNNNNNNSNNNNNNSNNNNNNSSNKFNNCNNINNDNNNYVTSIPCQNEKSLLCTPTNRFPRRLSLNQRNKLERSLSRQSSKNDKQPKKTKQKKRESNKSSSQKKPKTETNTNESGEEKLNHSEEKKNSKNESLPKNNKKSKKNKNVKKLASKSNKSKSRVRSGKDKKKQTKSVIGKKVKKNEKAKKIVNNKQKQKKINARSRSSKSKSSKKLLKSKIKNSKNVNKRILYKKSSAKSKPNSSNRNKSVKNKKAIKKTTPAKPSNNNSRTKETSNENTKEEPLKDNTKNSESSSPMIKCEESPIKKFNRKATEPSQVTPSNAEEVSKPAAINIVKQSKVKQKRTTSAPNGRVAVKRRRFINHRQDDDDCGEERMGLRFQRKTPCRASKRKQARTAKSTCAKKPIKITRHVKRNIKQPKKKKNQGTLPLSANCEPNDGAGCLEVISNWFDFYFSSEQPRSRRCRRAVRDESDSPQSKRKRTRCSPSKNPATRNHSIAVNVGSSQLNTASSNLLTDVDDDNNHREIDNNENSELTKSELNCLRLDEINFNDDYYYY